MQSFCESSPGPLAEHFCDVLIVGSGVAGLALALRLAPHCQVMLLSKSSLGDSNTSRAQGGIAVVFDETDTLQSHCQDTTAAGAGLCDPTCVEFVTGRARDCITWLIAQGMVFDSELLPSGQACFHLTCEGGHSHRRVLHAADATGRLLTDTLIARVRTQSTIHILENFTVIDLITTRQLGIAKTQQVVGAYLWHNKKQQVEIAYARTVVLATGGSAGLYQHSTNANRASGDGIAIAWRAGCRVANLEFNQFHPTTLYHLQAPNFLLTEALRGEGALLQRPDGSRFMHEFDPRAELAPRDIVAYAMYQEMQRLGIPCLYLSISHRPADFIHHHFPTLCQKLLALGLDLTRQPIPIVPAAHYTCGGIMVDHEGRSDISNLYAIGEVSYTGLHGANRLASNSLLECLVYACSAATSILQQLPYLTRIKQIPAWRGTQVQKCQDDSTVLLSHHWQILRSLMWEAVGLIRTTKGLEVALVQINRLKEQIDDYYAHMALSGTLLMLRNGVQVAQLTIRCALARRESRGVHYMLDHPQPVANPVPTILSNAP